MYTNSYMQSRFAGLESLQNTAIWNFSKRDNLARAHAAALLDGSFAASSGRIGGGNSFAEWSYASGVLTAPARLNIGDPDRHAELFAADVGKHGDAFTDLLR
jgi:hypothetical protein